ncbi:hypothetical protein MHBO_004992 [Bonamia ostreae]|uniref:26S proteasome regulatory subunit RPN11 C-terminal domain-containing protein n=1 Tax=Bonamia ostreae TaxID=126728 RepID=A0ABV2AVP5_9EUKA
MNAQLDERKSKENFDIRKVGLVDAKAHLQTLASEIIESNVSQTISSIYGLKIF